MESGKRTRVRRQREPGTGTEVWRKGKSAERRAGRGAGDGGAGRERRDGSTGRGGERGGEGRSRDPRGFDSGTDGWRRRAEPERWREAVPGLSPHYGQRGLQAELQEGRDPAHHQDSGEGRHVAGGPPCQEPP